MKILIINGPNLNLLGMREPQLYGSKDFQTFLSELSQEFPAISFSYFQSNVEGELINALHQCEMDTKGIILNAGGYTHTSVAIADAVASIKTPVIEVHISNIFSREDYRHVSILGKHCVGSITGFGLDSYRLGIMFFKDHERRI